MNLEIRLALPTDAPSISALIMGLSHYFTLEPDGAGAEDFYKTIQPQAIESYVQNNQFKYCVGLLDSQLVTVIAMRGNHVYHLFVSTSHQNKGISKRMWQHVLQQDFVDLTQPITVNASPYAVPVYQSFGFIESGECIKKNGVACIPMVLNVTT